MTAPVGCTVGCVGFLKYNIFSGVLNKILHIIIPTFTKSLRALKRSRASVTGQMF